MQKIIRYSCVFLFLVTVHFAYSSHIAKWEPVKIEGSNQTERAKSAREETNKINAREQELQKKIDERIITEEAIIDQEREKIKADRAAVKSYEITLQIEDLDAKKPKDYKTRVDALNKQLDAQKDIIKTIVDKLNAQSQGGFISGGDQPVVIPVAPVVPLKIQEESTQKVLEAVNQPISLPKRWYDRLQKFVLEVSVNVGESILNDPNKLISLREKLGTIYGRLGDLRKQAKNAYEISLLNDVAGKTNNNKQNIDLYLRNLKSIDAQLETLKKDTSSAGLKRVGEKEIDKLKYQRTEAVDLLATIISDLDEVAELDQLNGVETLKLDEATKSLIEEAKKLIIESTGKKSEDVEPWPKVTEADRAEVHQKQKEVIREYLDASSKLDFDDILGKEGKPGRLQNDYAKAIKTEAYRNLIKTIEMLDGIDLDQLDKEESGKMRFDQFSKIKFVLKLKDLVTRLDKAYQDVLSSPQISKFDYATTLDILQKSITTKKKKTLLVNKTFDMINYKNRKLPDLQIQLQERAKVKSSLDKKRENIIKEFNTKYGENGWNPLTMQGLTEVEKIQYQMLEGYNSEEKLFSILNPEAQLSVPMPATHQKELKTRIEKAKKILKDCITMSTASQVEQVRKSLVEISDFLGDWYERPEQELYYQYFEFLSAFRDSFVVIADKLSSQIKAKMSESKDFLGDDFLKNLLKTYNDLVPKINRIDVEQMIYLNDLTIPIYSIPPSEQKIVDFVVLPGLKDSYFASAYGSTGARERNKIDWAGDARSVLKDNPDIPLPELRKEASIQEKDFWVKSKEGLFTVEKTHVVDFDFQSKKTADFITNRAPKVLNEFVRQ